MFRFFRLFVFFLLLGICEGSCLTASGSSLATSETAAQTLVQNEIEPQENSVQSGISHIKIIIPIEYEGSDILRILKTDASFLSWDVDGEQKGEKQFEGVLDLENILKNLSLKKQSDNNSHCINLYFKNLSSLNLCYSALPSSNEAANTAYIDLSSCQNLEEFCLETPLEETVFYPSSRQSSFVRLNIGLNIYSKLGSLKLKNIHNQVEISQYDIKSLSLENCEFRNKAFPKTLENLYIKGCEAYNSLRLENLPLLKTLYLENIGKNGEIFSPNFPLLERLQMKYCASLDLANLPSLKYLNIENNRNIKLFSAQGISLDSLVLESKHKDKYFSIDFENPKLWQNLLKNTKNFIYKNGSLKLDEIYEYKNLVEKSGGKAHFETHIALDTCIIANKNTSFSIAQYFPNLGGKETSVEKILYDLGVDAGDFDGVFEAENLCEIRNRDNISFSTSGLYLIELKNQSLEGIHNIVKIKALDSSLLIKNISIKCNGVEKNFGFEPSVFEYYVSVGGEGERSAEGETLQTAVSLAAGGEAAGGEAAGGEALGIASEVAGCTVALQAFSFTDELVFEKTFTLKDGELTSILIVIKSPNAVFFEKLGKDIKLENVYKLSLEYKKDKSELYSISINQKDFKISELEKLENKENSYYIPLAKNLKQISLGAFSFNRSDLVLGTGNLALNGSDSIVLVLVPQNAVGSLGGGVAAAGGASIFGSDCNKGADSVFYTFYPKWTNANTEARLKNISFPQKDYILKPSFSPDSYEYEVFITDSADSLYLQVEFMNQHAFSEQGDCFIRCLSPRTEYKISVTAQDSVSKKLYVINFIKEDNALESNFAKTRYFVYPNPCKTHLRLGRTGEGSSSRQGGSVGDGTALNCGNFTSCGNSGIKKLSILDINGKTLFELKNNFEFIDIERLLPAIYFLRIETLDGGSEYIRFVKN